MAATAVFIDLIIFQSLHGYSIDISATLWLHGLEQYRRAARRAG
jgi:hypothetical protein